MQLLIILALLLYGGGNANKMLSEVKPVLESIGGEEMQKALKSAEEISEVLSLVKPFAAAKPHLRRRIRPKLLPRNFRLRRYLR